MAGSQPLHLSSEQLGNYSSGYTEDKCFLQRAEHRLPTQCSNFIQWCLRVWVSPHAINSAYEHKILRKFISVLEHLLALQAPLWLRHVLPTAASASRCALFSQSTSISAFICAFQCFSCGLPFLFQQLYPGPLSWIKNRTVIGWMLASSYDSYPRMCTAWFRDHVFLKKTSSIIKWIKFVTRGTTVLFKVLNNN